MASPNDEALREFLRLHPTRSYRPPGAGGDYPPSELAPVTRADGLWCLDEPSESGPQGSPRPSHEGDGENCHLWVIDERGRPCISQIPLERLGEGKLHHTNLTGGGEASVGGEVWFGEAPRIYFSGSSGRYPPDSPTHLEDAVKLFQAVGFEVLSLGWDREIDRPQRVWREPRQVVEA